MATRLHLVLRFVPHRETVVLVLAGLNPTDKPDPTTLTPDTALILEEISHP